MRLYPLFNVEGRVPTKSGFRGGRARESRSVYGFRGSPKTFNNGQCGSLGGKMRARLRRYDEDATGAVVFVCGVCRATKESVTHHTQRAPQPCAHCSQPANYPQGVSRQKSLGACPPDTYVPCPRPPWRGRDRRKRAGGEGAGAPRRRSIGAGAPKRRRGLHHDPVGGKVGSRQSNIAHGSARQTKTPRRFDVAAATSNPTLQQIGVGKMCFPIN